MKISEELRGLVRKAFSNANFYFERPLACRTTLQKSRAISEFRKLDLPKTFPQRRSRARSRSSDSKTSPDLERKQNSTKFDGSSVPGPCSCTTRNGSTARHAESLGSTSTDAVMHGLKAGAQAGSLHPRGSSSVLSTCASAPNSFELKNVFYDRRFVQKFVFFDLVEIYQPRGAVDCDGGALIRARRLLWTVRSKGGLAVLIIFEFPRRTRQSSHSTQ